MKRLILTILILLPILSFSQPKFFGGYEYFLKNKIKVESGESAVIHDLGQMKLIAGVKYSPVKFAELSLRSDTYFNPIKIDSYEPIQANYKIALKAKLNVNISLKIAHECIHPIGTDGRYHSKMFGGYTKIGIYYGM